ncbi:MAG: hypothetical protein AAGF94_06320 [Pseudomonadota bacterium]
MPQVQVCFHQGSQILLYNTVAAVDPAKQLQAALSNRPDRLVQVFEPSKAIAQIAQALEKSSEPFDPVTARAMLPTPIAWSIFHQSGDLLNTGPTQTILNDFPEALVM